MGAHSIAAKAVPELAISGVEAQGLAQSITKVMVAFNVPLVADPRVTASVGLFVTATAIYGPRLKAVRARRIAGGGHNTAHQKPDEEHQVFQ